MPTFVETVGPEPSNTVDKVVSRWKRLQAITTNFWDLWRQGYLTSLRERQVSLSQRNPSDMVPAVGCVVQIKDKMPRAQWRLGKIIELHKSGDEKVRSVTLRMSNGRKMTRPVKLLYPLEMQVEEPEGIPLPQSGSGVSGVPITSENRDEDSPVVGEEEFWGFDSQDVGVVTNKMVDVDRQIREIGPENAVSAEPAPRTAKILALHKLRRLQTVEDLEDE